MKLQIISCTSLKKYLGREDVLLLDLREKKEYETAHFPGAVWADPEQLEEKIATLLEEAVHEIKWIILSCDHGNISLLSARDLARHGYPVMSLGGGFEYCKLDPPKARKQ